MRELKNKKAVIYIRVNAEEQLHGSTQHFNPKKLTQKLKEENLHHFDVERYYFDIASGTSIKNRPGLTRLLNDIKTGKVNYILAKNTSTLTRSVPDLIKLENFFKENHCRFIPISRQLQKQRVR